MKTKMQLCSVGAILSLLFHAACSNATPHGEPDSEESTAARERSTAPSQAQSSNGTPGTRTARSPAETTDHADGASADLVLVEGVGREDDGYVKIPGEIRNESKAWYNGVKIEVQLFDDAGKPISVGGIKETGAAERVYASRDHLPPGESTPFEYLRDASKLSGKFHSFKLTVSGVKTASVGTAEVVDLAAPGDHGDFKVTGALKTTSTTPCSDPAIVVAGYDGAGRVVEVSGLSLVDGNDRTKFIRELAPGTKGQFEVLLRGPSVSTVKAFASCEAPR